MVITKMLEGQQKLSVWWRLPKKVGAIGCRIKDAPDSMILNINEPENSGRYIL